MSGITDFSKQSRVEHSIQLTERELKLAKFIMLEREGFAEEKGYKDTRGAKREDGAHLHNVGFAAEYAFAKFSGLFPTSMCEGLGEPDVGLYWEVKCAMVTNGHLILAPDTPDDKLCVLLTTNGKQFKGLFVIRGWMQASRAKSQQYYRETGRASAFWIPQRDLGIFHKKENGGVVMLNSELTPIAWCFEPPTPPGEGIDYAR